jgi:hypothetical protein
MPFVPDFRWMIDRIDCPLYSTATLFRKKNRGERHSVGDDIIEAINSYQSNYPSLAYLN